MSLKRNRVSPKRTAELAQPQGVYKIRCEGQHCDCKDFGSVCRRGFFSLWIQAVYGLYFAQKHQLPGYVDFGSKPYLYSNPALFEGDGNFWNYYYQQTPLTSTDVGILDQIQEDYPLRIWEKRHLLEVHDKVVTKLSMQLEVAQYVETLVEKCRRVPTLGLQIRLTDHPVEVEPVTMDHYNSILRRSQNQFQQFFIATDDSRVIDQLVDEWGTARILFQPAIRSQSEQPIHTNMHNPRRYQLGLEVLTDCYALSSCRKALLVHSNISYGALLLNPHLTYQLLETSTSRQHRLKTSLLYWLDRWGIRKM